MRLYSVGKVMKALLFTLALLVSVKANVWAQKPVSWLALGDSYTIGESVNQKKSFPFQLSDFLRGKGIAANPPKIIARTGWTTDELQEAITKENLHTKFDFVTLLIGVNNQFRGYPEAVYRKELKQLLVTAINFAGGKKDRVFVISIPDWGATPYASNLNRSQIGTEIDRYNAICKAETMNLGLSFTDITPASRKALKDRLLIAGDGLHPSGKMYSEWVGQAGPKIQEVLKK